MALGCLILQDILCQSPALPIDCRELVLTSHQSGLCDLSAGSPIHHSSLGRGQVPLQRGTLPLGTRQAGAVVLQLLCQPLCLLRLRLSNRKWLLQMYVIMYKPSAESR